MNSSLEICDMTQCQYTLRRHLEKDDKIEGIVSPVIFITNIIIEITGIILNFPFVISVIISEISVISVILQKLQEIMAILQEL